MNFTGTMFNEEEVSNARIVPIEFCDFTETVIIKHKWNSRSGSQPTQAKIASMASIDRTVDHSFCPLCGTAKESEIFIEMGHAETGPKFYCGTIIWPFQKVIQTQGSKCRLIQKMRVKENDTVNGADEKGGELFSF